MKKSNIVYVESHTSNMGSIIQDIALIYGVNPATNKVQKWFNEYSAFVYDSETGNILFYKSRYAGYWDTDKNIYDYKK
jgi:hypothetical protein